MRAGIGFLIVLCACGGEGKLPFKPDAGSGDERKQVASVPATPNRDLDLLFVIDDSGSMADKQNTLAANFPSFINVLNTLEGGLPNLHLGVVSTDMGTKGVDGTQGPNIGAVGQGGCAGPGDDGALQTNGAPVSGNFLTDIRQTDGTRLRNYTGDLATAFSQMARLGATGCGFEQPLHAMQRALQNTAANAGFLRPNALLGIVFLADEDDCSVKDPMLLQPSDATLGPLQSFRCTRFGVTCAQGGQNPDQMNEVGTKGGCTAAVGSTYLPDIAPFVSFVKGLKSDPGEVIVAGITGPTEPFAIETRTVNNQEQPALARSCTYQGANGVEVADPGVRLKTFLDAFPDRSSFSTICQTDLSQALAQFGALVNLGGGSPCIAGSLRDTDANAPGIQPDCIVEDVIRTNATVIPQCGSPETPPCWRLESDPQLCTQFDMLKLVVSRSSAPDPATVTTMRCLVQ